MAVIFDAIYPNEITGTNPAAWALIAESSKHVRIFLVGSGNRSLVKAHFEPVLAKSTNL